MSGAIIVKHQETKSGDHEHEPGQYDGKSRVGPAVVQFVLQFETSFENGLRAARFLGYIGARTQDGLGTHKC
jgi:hypothetical protein